MRTDFAQRTVLGYFKLKGRQLVDLPPFIALRDRVTQSLLTMMALVRGMEYHFIRNFLH
jgi:hypothetical protein